MRGLLALLAGLLLLMATAGSALAYDTTLHVQVLNNLYADRGGPVGLSIKQNGESKINTTVSKGDPGTFVVRQPAMLGQLTTYDIEIVVRVKGDDYRSVICYVTLVNTYGLGPQVTDFQVSTMTLSKRVYAVVNSRQLFNQGDIFIKLNNLNAAQ